MKTIILAAVAAGVLVSGCGAGAASGDADKPKPEPAAAAAPAEPETFDVGGTLALVGEGFGWGGDLAFCTGEDGYDDVGAGAQVKVTDADGTVIAVGDLEEGDVDGMDCVFRFVVREVPATEGIYGIEVADRGVLNYSLDELQAEQLELTLG